MFLSTAVKFPNASCIISFLDLGMYDDVTYGRSLVTLLYNSVIISSVTFSPEKSKKNLKSYNN